MLHQLKSENVNCAKRDRTRLLREEQPLAQFATPVNSQSMQQQLALCAKLERRQYQDNHLASN